MIALLSGGPSFAIEGYYLIDFAVYVGLLVFFLRKPIADFVATRRATIVADIEEARKLRDEAREKLVDYEKRLDNLEDEIQAILSDARTAGEEQRKQMMLEASKAAERLRADAKNRLETETRKLQHELQTRTVELAVQVAEGLISTKMAASHRRRFVSDYITDLEGREGEL